MRSLLLLLLLCLPALHAADDRPKRVAAAELQKRINTAIDKGVVYLKRIQNKDGSWTYPMFARGGKSDNRMDGTGGLTALALYALAASGVRSDDGAIVRGLRWTEKHTRPFKAGGVFSTYSGSLLVLALTRIDARKHAKRIRRLAARIVKAQRKSNMWTYNLDGTGGERVNGPLADGDNSNSQFAVLAMWAAKSLAGARIPRGTWRRVQGFYKKTQLDDGAWTYTPKVAGPGIGRMGGSMSMTAAGLVSYVYATAALDGSLPLAREHSTAKRGLAAVRKGFKNYGDEYKVMGLAPYGEPKYMEEMRQIVHLHDDGSF